MEISSTIEYFELGPQGETFTNCPAGRIKYFGCPNASPDFLAGDYF